MVYFTCIHCGASIKKSNVEKHYNMQCRGPVFVTCVDCLKDFNAESFAAHTKCITENEKYSQKGSASRPPSYKGEAKHNAWIDLVNHVIQAQRDIPPIELSFMDSLAKHENIPQKKAKFLNFAKNIWRSGKFHSSAVEKVWNLLETEFRKTKMLGDESNDTMKNKVVENSTEVCDKGIEEISKKVKEVKHEESLNEESGQPVNDSSTSSNTNEEINVSKKYQKRKYKIECGDEDKNTPNNTLLSNGDTKKVKYSQNLTSFECGQDVKPLNGEQGNSDSSVSGGSDKSPYEQFRWSKTITDVLAASGQELPLKVLRKHVLTKFVATGREFEYSFDVKLTKRLSKLASVTVQNDVVKFTMQ